jgi:outer membrane protein assembly factor BamA
MSRTTNFHAYLSFIFSLLFACSLSAQDTTATISNIILIGNKITDDNVIMRELTIGIGDIAREEDLILTRQRLENLFLFNRVEINTYPQDNNRVLLVIEVTERLYFYPVPILTINERDWSKWSYGLGLVNANFRGQNEQVWGGAWFGYRPGFGITYSDQWAGDSLHLNTAFSLSKTIYNHRTITDLEERHIFGWVSVGKWWNYHFNTSLVLHYDRIQVAEEFRRLMQSGNTTEHTFGVELIIRYDTRDVYFYPANGWFSKLNIFQFGLLESYNHYTNLVFDLRRYQSIGPLIFAARFMQNSLFGAIPVYRLNYLGYSERVRGHFYTAIEGKHLQIGSLETRFNIIPVQYFSTNFPMIPEQYQRNLKIGLSGALFIDTGIVWNEPDQYRSDNFLTGFGFGLHFHLPYVEIFRIDYGLNSRWHGQVIFEVGVVF